MLAEVVLPLYAGETNLLPKTGAVTLGADDTKRRAQVLLQTPAPDSAKYNDLRNAFFTRTKRTDLPFKETVKSFLSVILLTILREASLAQEGVIRGTRR